MDRLQFLSLKILKCLHNHRRKRAAPSYNLEKTERIWDPQYTTTYLYPHLILTMSMSSSPNKKERDQAQQNWWRLKISQIQIKSPGIL
jgi:hypothetical protein